MINCIPNVCIKSTKALHNSLLNWSIDIVIQNCKSSFLVFVSFVIAYHLLLALEVVGMCMYVWCHGPCDAPSAFILLLFKRNEHIATNLSLSHMHTHTQTHTQHKPIKHYTKQQRHILLLSLLKYYRNFVSAPKNTTTPSTDAYVNEWQQQYCVTTKTQRSSPICDTATLSMIGRTMQCNF